MNIVLFDRNEKDPENIIGKGYLTTGDVKTRFTLIKTAKNAEGFFVSLPYFKKEDGSFSELVTFANNNSRLAVLAAMKEKMSSQGLTSVGLTPDSSPSQSPTNVNTGNGAPADDGLADEAPF